MSFMKKKSKGDDSATEELKKKAFNDEYNLETDTLLVQAKRFTEAVKILKKEGNNIHRKRKKENSRSLSKCMDTYDEHLNELKETLAVINQHLGKSLRNTPILKQRSERFTGTHGRIGQTQIEERVEKIPRDEVSMENSERQSAGSRKRARHSEPNQSERTGTDGDFERYEHQSSAKSHRNAPEELEQKVKLLKKETERLQYELQAEKTEKDKVFKELEDAKKETNALEDKLRDFQKHSSKEKHDLEEYIRRLRQEKDRISDERDNKRFKYETEKEAKDNALKSLEDIKQDKRALEEELGSFLKQSTSERHAVEEDNKRLSRENDHISRERDDERKRYKTEKDAKDSALARLEAIKRDKFAVEEELKKIVFF
ncbi:cingulin-like [Ruditapes philippinarum]|uniref:cingulin-like n=1 Tax=Ruditapes philippinarum TaxID=129788 RepID=UPI00295B68DB|nr:cingulin-like [Ruditapes philippinarum]